MNPSVDRWIPRSKGQWCRKRVHIYDVIIRTRRMCIRIINTQILGWAHFTTGSHISNSDWLNQHCEYDVDKWSHPHKQDYVITQPCVNFTGGLAKRPVKLWHGWAITSHKTMGEITYPFRNFNGCTVEVSEWISYFTMYVMYVITHPCWD